MVREENNAIIGNNPFDQRTSLHCNLLSKTPCQLVMLLLLTNYGMYERNSMAKSQETAILLYWHDATIIEV